MIRTSTCWSPLHWSGGSPAPMALCVMIRTGELELLDQGNYLGCAYSRMVLIQSLIWLFQILPRLPALWSSKTWFGALRSGAIFSSLHPGLKWWWTVSSSSVKERRACLLRLTLQGAAHCCSNVNVYEGCNKILNGMNNWYLLYSNSHTCLFE